MVARLFYFILMKKPFLLVFLSFFCLLAAADEPIDNLVVWAKDGTKVAYALAEKPKVTFTETDLVITSDGIEVHYALENMLRFTFDNSPAAGITDLMNGKMSISINEESLLFPSLKTNNTVSIYSASGMLVFRHNVQQDGVYSFPLSNLNNGVYLVNVNGLTYKIVKR